MVLEKDKLRRSMDFFWETEFQNSKVYDVWTSVCPQFLIYFLLQVGGTYVRVLCCVMEYRVTNSNGKRTKQLEEKNNGPIGWSKDEDTSGFQGHLCYSSYLTH